MRRAHILLIGTLLIAGACGSSETETPTPLAEVTGHQWVELSTEQKREHATRAHRDLAEINGEAIPVASLMEGLDEAYEPCGSADDPPDACDEPATEAVERLQDNYERRS